MRVHFLAILLGLTTATYNSFAVLLGFKQVQPRVSVVRLPNRDFRDIASSHQEPNFYQ